MALTLSTMLALGTKAPGFRLPDTDGRTVALDDFAGKKGLLVMFICSHCPYVKHVRAELARLGGDCEARGVGVVAIASNDVSQYPQDGPAGIKEEKEGAGYSFPYLFDETQEVARAYRAACTPDLFLFDAAMRLVYRGQLDDSRPGNDVPVTGKDLRAAVDAMLEGRPLDARQKASMGCNIKWKPHHEPDYVRSLTRMPRNAQWRLAARPEGLFKPTDFRWVEEDTPPLAEGSVLVRTAYLSLDPTNRGWAAGDTYLPAVPLDGVMRGFGVGHVVESRDPAFAPGEAVSGLLGWQRYAVIEGRSLAKLPAVGLPLEAHLGLLGHIGLTAWVGLLKIGRPRAGETLVVSAAAGAVGSLVGQVGKILGLRVVGITGTEEKCRWLTETLGFDAAVNYRKTIVRAGLRRACPDGIDVYFDNVGGPTLEAVLALINRHARIVVCGLISQYTAKGPVPGPNLGSLLVQRARMEGFIVLDHIDQAAAATADLVRWHREGRLRYRLDVVEGLESAPLAVNRLFEGGNTGKLVVRVAEPPA